MHWRLQPLEGMGAEIVAGKVPLYQAGGGITDHDCVGRGQPLETGGQVGRVPEGQVFVPPAAAHLADHHPPGVDADPHRQADARVPQQAGRQRPHRLQHAQAGAHGALRVIFMRLRIAKVDEQAIAQVLGDMPSKALDHGDAGGLVGADHLAEVFGIELPCQGVESARSQNSTVSWRRSASGTLGATWADASCGVWTAGKEPGGSSWAVVGHAWWQPAPPRRECGRFRRGRAVSPRSVRLSRRRGRRHPGQTGVGAPGTRYAPHAGAPR